jgi:uncharacterized membrane protein
MTVYTVTTLKDLGNGGTSAYAVNNAGQIVGRFSVYTASPISVTYYGFLYNPNDGTYTGLQPPLTQLGGLGGGSSAYGINDVGQVVGYYNGLYPNIGTHGYLYRGGTYTTLDDPLAGPSGTYAYGIKTRARSSGIMMIAAPRPTPSCTAAAPTRPSTSPWQWATPMHTGSTTRARSSGPTMTPASTPTASSIAAASSPPSTIHRPPTPLRPASTISGRSSGITPTAPFNTASSTAPVLISRWTTLSRYPTSTTAASWWGV